MKDVLTTAAHMITAEAGARLILTPGVAYDTTDSALSVMAGALLRQMEGTGIDLLALRRDGTTLIAEVSDDLADEPLCPAAFHRVVRRLSHDRLGEVWDGEFVVADTGPVKSPAARSRVA